MRASSRQWRFLVYERVKAASQFPSFSCVDTGIHAP